jgi:Na+/proline symporter
VKAPKKARRRFGRDTDTHTHNVLLSMPGIVALLAFALPVCWGSFPAGLEWLLFAGLFVAPFALLLAVIVALRGGRRAVVAINLVGALIGAWPLWVVLLRPDWLGRGW